jgi:uncharacterized protein
MEDDPSDPPESLLPYAAWTRDSLRQVVARAIEHVAREGLPGDHHFYITFRTDHPRTILPDRLRAQYPREMTIVLQHQFHGLAFDTAAGLIQVGLSFGGVPAKLTIPLAAITQFADPAIRFMLQFEADDAEDTEAAEEKPAEEKLAPPLPVPAGREEGASQVVSLDAFRRRAGARDQGPPPDAKADEADEDTPA